MRRVRLLLALAGLLSACVESSTVTADGATFPAAPVQIVAATKDAGRVGSAVPSIELVKRIFNASCVDTLPDFKGAHVALTGLGMRQNPSTATYLNSEADLSVALVKAGRTVTCSIIFATTSQDPKKVADQVAAYAVGKGKRMFVQVIGKSADRTYLNAQIAAQ